MIAIKFSSVNFILIFEKCRVGHTRNPNNLKNTMALSFRSIVIKLRGNKMHP